MRAKFYCIAQYDAIKLSQISYQSVHCLSSFDAHYVLWQMLFGLSIVPFLVSAWKSNSQSIHLSVCLYIYLKAGDETEQTAENTKS